MTERIPGVLGEGVSTRTRWASLVLLGLFGALMIAASPGLPRVGDANSVPANHVADYYIEKGYEQTGVPNIVTAVLADYRGYDTMGETTVIFVAGLSCLLILGTQRTLRRVEELDLDSPFGSVVLDLGCRLLVPFILLFALYVVFHGHSSPGGGFQGGTFLAAAAILIRLVRGKGESWGFSRRQALIVASIGGSLYVWIGIIPMFYGKQFLDYSGLPLAVTDIPHLRAYGTLGIELGVALTVMGVLIIIFDCLLGKEE